MEVRSFPTASFWLFYGLTWQRGGTSQPGVAFIGNGPFGHRALITRSASQACLPLYRLAASLASSRWGPWPCSLVKNALKRTVGS